MSWLNTTKQFITKLRRLSMNDDDELTPLGADDFLTAVDRPVLQLSEEEKNSVQVTTQVAVQDTIKDKRSEGLKAYWAKKREEKNNAEKTIKVLSSMHVERNKNEEVLFFVEGEVLLQNIVPGGGVVQAKQNRIVYAVNYEEAIKKYHAFFTNLSNDKSRYTIINCAVSEAIR